MAKEYSPEVEYLIDLIKHSAYDDLCNICAHYKPCLRSKCPEFMAGNSVTIEGKHVDFEWTCEDFDYGDCPVREVYCKGCIENGNVNFEWKGLPEDDKQDS